MTSAVRLDQVKSRSLRGRVFVCCFFYAGPCQAAGGTPGAHGFFTHVFSFCELTLSQLFALCFVEQFE